MTSGRAIASPAGHRIATHLAAEIVSAALDLRVVCLRNLRPLPFVALRLYICAGNLPRSAALVPMLIILAAVFGLAVLPQMWVRRVIARAFRRADRILPARAASSPGTCWTR